ncbi:ubiquitin-conjugating enzyme E2 T-like isoform X2 [Photinus pyralis]|uniref:ubiquitin-conjugating enzyme E2 T-like isoform X2 n=1 Tax=Photinus pyralis TaxID=7054 RepID=UPI0012670445|nr:ubiquitin-conjugating enzyme E2 T-like isoform X2 [Photinus pyralis]
MQKQQRLLREIAKIAQSPPKGSIIGPENTPYYKGTFNLEILIPENYPFSPPSIKFLTKVYHPNIDDSGRICLDLIKMPPKGNWKPTIGLEGLLIAIKMLLENPNPDDPLMMEIAEEFKNNKSEFERKARTCTEDYAIQ